MRINRILPVLFIVGCGQTSAGNHGADAGAPRSDMAVANGGGGGGQGGGGGGTGRASTDMAMGGGGGGSGTLMKFAVFGDSRPPNDNDTTGYPSSIISGIFALAQSNGAQFVVGTGDYMFATDASAVTAQVALFKQAMASYSAGPVYLTMGNHECTGADLSNCPNLNETANIKAFMQMVPAGVTTPYYRIDVNTPLGKAKFVFIAANSWDASNTQQNWLETQLSDATTYTFVIRHESTTSSGVPACVATSEAIVAAHPYTVELLGHTHEYRRVDTQHVISGNAGAPLDSGTEYGLLLVEQQTNGNITVSEMDEATGMMTDTWTVSPTGQKM